MDNITTINLATCPLQYLSIGYVGETGARPVKFDFSAWATEYGSGVLQLLLQRPGDADPYPVVLDIDGTTATWTPDGTATEKTGQGQAQLIYTVGGVVVKNAIFRVLIAPSLGAEGDPPEPYEDWLQRLLTIAAEAQQSAIDAAGSAEAAGTSAGAAAGSAGAAAKSALDAEAAKSGAEAAEQTAQQAAALARAKAAQAAEAAQIAGREADYAQQQNIAAGYSAESAHDDAERAAQSAEDAQAAASAAQSAASAAAASASAAAGSAANAAATVTEVETKGAEQIAAINQAGATQIAAVNAAGTAQVQAIEDKGEEVIASIPPDYTELTDDVSDLKSSVVNDANGIDTFKFYGSFAVGGLNTDGTLKPAEKTRVSSNNVDKMSFDRDIIVSVKSGFVWGYIPFTGSTPGAWRGWLSQDIIIQAGTEFVVQIRKDPEGSATADVDEYVSALTFKTAINEGVTDSKNALIATGATFKPQVTKISNINVVTNGTAFVANNAYDTYVAKVHANTQCIITVTTNGNVLRLSFSSDVPANGVSCTFIAEKSVSGSIEIDYTPQEDGYLNVSIYRPSSFEMDVKETYSGEIQKIANSINAYNNPVTVYTANVNIPTNGTSYAGNNSYRTKFIKAQAGNVYVFTISANAGNNYYRFAKSATEPANGVQATFVEEINNQSAEFTYTYNATSDGFFGVTSYYTVMVAVDVVSMGLTQRIERLESNFIECDKTFDGEYINTKKQSYRVKSNPFNLIQPGETFEIPQDIAIYNNTLFTAFNGAKLIMIQDMATGTEIGRPQNNAVGHADSIAFSKEFYDPSDDYPLLYVGTLTDGNVCAFRITASALTLVKTYHFDTSAMGYYMDMCLDPVNMLMYTFGYTENSYNTNPNGTNYIIMGCFDLKATTTDQSGNLLPTMLYKRTLPYIMTMQGSTMFNGKLWHVSSDYTQHNTNIYVISTGGYITNIIGDFDANIKDKECEGIAFYPSGDRYNMMLLTGDNKLHIVEFAD